jgi:hypothetical protein
MDLPGLGEVRSPGAWDLRKTIKPYLGCVDLSGKTVLECGPASGFCTFWMEAQGASVASYDLSREHEWDVVPFAGLDTIATIDSRREHIDQINNAWWLAHRLNNSDSRVCYGSIYSVPPALGSFDIVTMAQFLGHVRDPFRAMEVALSHCRTTAVINGTPPRLPRRVHRRIGLACAERWTRPHMYLIPNWRDASCWDTWWNIPAELIVAFLGILGFDDAVIDYHTHESPDGPARLFTVVATRRRGSPQVC